MLNKVNKLSQKSLRHIVLFIFISCFISVAYFLYQNPYFTLLQKYHSLWQQWTFQHYFLSVIIFMLIYVFIVLMSLPITMLATVTAGFLFGPIAILYVVMSGTVGASILFMLVRFVFHDWVKKRAHHWVIKWQKGFQENALSYLFFLRVVPLFPFSAVNLVAALMGVRLWLFQWVTFIGIIPATIVYVMVGNGLNGVLLNQAELPTHIMLEPTVFLPLLFFAMMLLLPIIYKVRKGKG